MKKIYLSTGILVATVVAILAAFNAISTTYTFDSPRSDLGSQGPTLSEDTTAADTLSTGKPAPTEPKEQTTTDITSQSDSSARPTTTPEKTETASASSAAPVQQKSYTIRVETSGTALSAMEEFAKTSHFEFKTKEFPGLGVMIEEINGLKNSDGYYWILYINGKTSDKGASAAEVSPGDSIEWRYEKGY